MVEVRINGSTYDLFKQIDLNRSIDDFVGEIRINLSEAQNEDSILKTNDLVEVFFDGIQVFTGYLEVAGDNESSNSHDVSFRARDTVCDLIDSSVPDNVKAVKNVQSFADLVQLCIDGLGLADQISVIDEVGAKFNGEIKATAPGQKVGEFLNENARIVQVFLNTDGKGNVLISIPSGELSTTLKNIPGETDNNIKAVNYSEDLSDRYYKYIVRSGESISGGKGGKGKFETSGVAFDNSIRQSRVLEIVSRKPMTDIECENAAKEEANIRRARSFKYDCEIVGFSSNGELWAPGPLVPVRDEKRGVIGKFRVNTVGYSYSRGGEQCKLSITWPDKLEVEAEPTPQTEKTTAAGTTYTVVAGDTLWLIAQRNKIKLEDLIAANPQISNPNRIFVNDEVVIPSV